MHESKHQTISKFIGVQTDPSPENKIPALTREHTWNRRDRDPTAIKNKCFTRQFSINTPKCIPCVSALGGIALQGESRHVAGARSVVNLRFRGTLPSPIVPRTVPGSRRDSCLESGGNPPTVPGFCRLLWRHEGSSHPFRLCHRSPSAAQDRQR
jgi:hypothetical protein